MKPSTIPELVRLDLHPPGFANELPLEIDGGTTVVTGINNVGKSRLLAAIYQIRQWWDAPFSLASAWSFHLEWHRDATQLILELKVPERRARFQRLLTESRPPKEIAAIDATIVDERLMTVTMRGGLQRPSAPTALHLPPVCNEAPELAQTLQRLILVPPQRGITSEGVVKPQSLPDPRGDDLPTVLMYWFNERDARFEQLERLMAHIFPEVERIVPRVAGENRTRLEIADRYSKQRIPLAECGTGLQQILHLASMVLFFPSGRLFLIDEPHAYLHGSAERTLARFFRSHPEHGYIIITHSPLMIDELQPDHLWLVNRDEQGAQVQPLLRSAKGVRGNRDEWRRLLELLGWRPSQFAWADRILFVEDDSDEDVWQTWFDLWGWSPGITRCGIVSIRGYGTTVPLKETIAQLSDLLSVPMVFVLDGDQRNNPVVQSDLTRFLPDPEIENILIRSPKAVYQAIVAENPLLQPEHRQALIGSWTLERVREFLAHHASPKGSKRLADLVHEMELDRLGVPYNKRRDNPRIAREMSGEQVDDIRRWIEPFVREGKIPESLPPSAGNDK